MVLAQKYLMKYNSSNRIMYIGVHMVGEILQILESSYSINRAESTAYSHGIH